MMTPEQLTGYVDTHLIDARVGTQSILLHPQVERDLQTLVQAAQCAGFQMEIASGFRDFSRQKSIWNGKFSGPKTILDQNSQPLDKASLSEQEKMLAILRWSALPGASRHHWGCDFDVYARDRLPDGVSLQLEPWEYTRGHQREFSHWLSQNVSHYGFFLPYRRDRGGVASEPWHISHIATATCCLAQFSINDLQRQLNAHPIDGVACVLENLTFIYNQFIANICPPEAT